MSEDMDSEVGGGEATGGDAPTLTQTPWTGDLRLLLLIAGPNVVSTAAQTIMSFVDYAIVSKLPNASAAQAATSCGGVIWFSVFSFLLGVMVCVTTTVSQSFGAKRPRDCSAYAWQGLWICMLFGAGSLALWPVLPWFFNIIGHTPDVQAMEAEYTQIRLLSMGAAGATVALAQFFIGIHRPGVNAASAVAATVLNAVLTYCLVFGKCGLPAMGVAGAAWGTVIATCFRTLWLLAAMCFGRKAAEFHARRTWRIDADKMRRLIRVGWPSGLQFFLEIAAWAVLLVVLVGRFGTVHLAAMSTVWRFLELSFMPAIGIAVAVCTTVGKAIGEGRPDLARRRAALGNWISMCYMGLMGVVYFIWRTSLMDIFSDDEAVIALGSQLFIFAAVFQLFDAAAITYSNALRGAGDTRWPAVVGVALNWIILICGSVWVIRAHPELGSKGPWLFATLTIIVIGIVFWIRWRRGKWEQIDVIGRTEPQAIPLADASRDGSAPAEPTTPAGSELAAETAESRS